MAARPLSHSNTRFSAHAPRTEPGATARVPRPRSDIQSSPLPRMQSMLVGRYSAAWASAGRAWTHNLRDADGEHAQEKKSTNSAGEPAPVSLVSHRRHKLQSGTAHATRSAKVVPPGIGT
eukprot:6192226-Prymnesium_polylepis.1